ncbi:MAG: crosslink repair DNA glycosylase YcaQ family protein [Kangiellaceae bacterium]
MIRINHPNDFARIRRLSLSSQGLFKTAPFGSGLAGARKAIQHIGYLQLDTISVIERAHHHVLYSRVPNFKPNHLDKLLLNKEIFEYWSHAAAFLPIEDYRYSLPYKHAIKNGQTHWYKNPDKKLMKELLDRIRTDGPLRSRDIETASKKQAGWWDWKPSKKALEQLYMQGDLMVTNRHGFQKTYDLAERVLPSSIDTSMPTIDEFARHMVEQQLKCHGLVSLKGFTYLRRNSALRKAVKELIQSLLTENKLQDIQINDTEVFYITTGLLDSPLPRANKRLTILSPFDNCVIQRDRLKTIFDFDYQIECYLPATKRKFGYFCLPLLFGEQFIGRMDCKAHRADRHLEIKALYIEQPKIDFDAFLDAFSKCLKTFCNFQNCDSISINTIQPTGYATALKTAVEF